MSAKKKKPQPPCGRRNKSCRECKYRYKAGDKTWECPKCGVDRHCATPKMHGYETCRMHGGKGTQKKEKVILTDKLSATFNRILEEDELLELSFERGMTLAQLEELLKAWSESDTAGVGQEVDKGLSIAHSGLINRKESQVQKGLNIINEARSVEKRKESLERRSLELIKVRQLLVTSDHRMRLDSEIQVTGTELLEVLSFFQSLMFTLLKDRPTDQTWFMRKFREKWGNLGEDK